VRSSTLREKRELEISQKSLNAERAKHQKKTKIKKVSTQLSEVNFEAIADD